MTPEDLRSATALLNLDGVKELAGRLRALGLVRTLEYVQKKRGQEPLSRALAAGLGFDGVEPAVRALEQGPRELRLDLEQRALRLAAAAHQLSRVDPPIAATPLSVAATPWEVDGSRRALTSQRHRAEVRHAGLYASRLLLVEEGGEGKARELNDLVKRASRPEGPEGYAQAYARWVGFTAPGPERCVQTVKSEGWLLCGLGNPSPTENGLSLHPTWGVPWVPGTSLKGITRAWLRAQGASSTELAEWFGSGGDGGQAGAVDFLDAWWRPNPGGLSPLVVDVVTPHQGKYYQGARPPDGMESPVPSSFLAARGDFRLVVEGPAGWVERALEMVTRALREHGVGAKTRAGYGRLVETEPDPADQRARARAQQVREEQERAARAEEEAATRRALPLGQRLQRVVDQDGLDALREWFLGRRAVSGLEIEEETGRAVFQLLFDQGRAKGLRAEAPPPFSAWAGERAAAVKEAPVSSDRAFEAPFDLLRAEEALRRRTKKGRVDFNALADDLARWGLAEVALPAAEDWLRRQGAADGHVKKLRAGR